MTTKDEALKLALKALELLVDGRQTEEALDYGDNAIAAIKEALAQPKQEPTWWLVEYHDWASPRLTALYG